MVLSRFITATCCAALAILFASASFASAGQYRVAVLVSHDSESYREALEGFRESLGKDGVDAEIDVYYLTGDGYKATTAVSQAVKRGSSLILSIGELATQASLDGSGDIPVVAGMVLSADTLAGAHNATGVVLEYPLDTQLDLLGEILPKVRTVGVIYSSAVDDSALAGIRMLGRSRGLRFKLRKIDSPRDLPSALEYMAKDVEAIMAVNDRVVFTTQTAKHILLFSYRNRLPLIGLSQSWVKAGALYSLERDYKDIGAQCAGIALRVLRGAPAGSIPHETPRKKLYCINLKTARHMKVDLPDSVKDGAYKVYKE